MPTYVYRCPACGPFERSSSMRTVADTLPCPACEASSGRTVTAPALHAGGTTRAVAAAHERAAHAPGVVSAVPPGRAPGAAPTRPTTTDPRHARLPRP